MITKTTLRVTAQMIDRTDHSCTRRRPTYFCCYGYDGGDDTRRSRSRHRYEGGCSRRSGNEYYGTRWSESWATDPSDAASIRSRSGDRRPAAGRRADHDHEPGGNAEWTEATTASLPTRRCIYEPNVVRAHSLPYRHSWYHFLHANHWLRHLLHTVRQ